jgi:phosphoribosylformylglycinamidine synthase subunit PurL
MAGGIGASVSLPGALPAHAFLFGEDQARYALTASQPDALLAAARQAGVAAHILGKTGGDALTIRDIGAISVTELRRINEAWLPAYMAAAS